MLLIPSQDFRQSTVLRVKYRCAQKLHAMQEHYGSRLNVMERLYEDTAGQLCLPQLETIKAVSVLEAAVKENGGTNTWLVLLVLTYQEKNVQKSA